MYSFRCTWSASVAICMYPTREMHYPVFDHVSSLIKWYTHFFAIDRIHIYMTCVAYVWVYISMYNMILMINYDSHDKKIFYAAASDRLH